MHQTEAVYLLEALLQLLCASAHQGFQSGVGWGLLSRHQNHMAVPTDTCDPFKLWWTMYMTFARACLTVEQVGTEYGLLVGDQLIIQSVTLNCIPDFVH